MKKMVLLFISWLYISTANAMQPTVQSALTDMPQELQAIIISIASQKDNLLNALAEFKRQAAINKQFRNIVNDPNYIKAFVKLYLSKHDLKDESQNLENIVIPQIQDVFRSDKKIPKNILIPVADVLLELGNPNITFEILYQASFLDQIKNLINIFKENQVAKLISNNSISKEKQFKLINTAIDRGNLDMVKFLIKAGVDINVKDKNSLSPLIKALFFDKLDIAIFLINNKNTDVNIRYHGATPLYLATIKLREAPAHLKQKWEEIINLIKEKSQKK